MSRRKELWHINIDQRYFEETPQYRSYFSHWSGEPVIGESTPSYLTKGILYKTVDRSTQYFSSTDSAARRIARCAPDAKIILSLRSPIARLESAYRKNRAQKKDHIAESIEKHVYECIDRLSGDPGRSNSIFVSKYAIHLDEMFTYFRNDNVFILIFEEWTQRPEEFLPSVFSFVGLELAEESPIVSKKNSFAEYRSADEKEAVAFLTPEVKQKLIEIFEPDVAYVERMIGRELPAWYHE
jgi:Sulfotransferase domain